MSESVTRLFGCTPRDYLSDPYFWRHRVHPDDIAHINAWVDRMFETTSARSSIASGAPTAHISGCTTGSMSCATPTASRPRSSAHGRTSPNARKRKLPNEPAASTSCSAPCPCGLQLRGHRRLRADLCEPEHPPMLGYRAEDTCKMPTSGAAVHPDDLPEVEAKQAELFRRACTWPSTTSR